MSKGRFHEATDEEGEKEPHIKLKETQTFTGRLNRDEKIRNNKNYFTIILFNLCSNSLQNNNWDKDYYPLH